MTRRSPSAPRPTAAVPLILVQVITIVWSKASRGGRAAGLRNRVPAALPIPAAFDLGTELRGIVHDVWYGEEDGFAHPRAADVRAVPVVDTVHHGDLALTPTDGMIRVDLNWGAFDTPRRRPIRGVMTLRPEEWGQLRYNGRSSGVTGYDHPWRYTQSTINVGIFHAPHADAFLETEPTKMFRGMADLW